MINARHNIIIFSFLMVLFSHLSMGTTHLAKSILDRLSDDINQYFIEHKVLLTQEFSPQLINAYGDLLSKEVKDKVLSDKQNLLSQLSNKPFDQQLFIGKMFRDYYGSADTKHLYASAAIMAAQGTLKEKSPQQQLIIQYCPTSDEEWSDLGKAITTLYEKMRVEKQEDKDYTVWNFFLERIICGLRNSITKADDIIFNLTSNAYMVSTKRHKIFSCISEFLRQATIDTVYDFLVVGDQTAREVLTPPAQKEIGETMQAIIQEKKINVDAIQKESL